MVDATRHDQPNVERLTSRLRAFYFGGDYNPEQWTPALGYDDEAVWREDMRLMKLAGVNVATVGVFSWVSLQPDEHTFTFEWLDRVLDLLAENGIYACLATATAAQPAWLSAAYPDVLPMDPTGMRRGHGERQNYCPTSPDFRRLSRGMARRLAERYHNHPALLLWHVSNEYYGGGTEQNVGCHCDRCAARFREWLLAHYGSLDEVNRRWVTAFWSHTYTDWEQIVPPGPRTDRGIQGQILDWRRFVSDVYLECYMNEVEALREVTPDVPITTNFMGDFKPLDYFTWAPHLDVVSWDSYPSRTMPPADIAFRHDLMRGLKSGQSFLLMEQTPSQVQWKPQNPLKRPGVMRLLSYQAVAHGADAVMFFQWRQSRGSSEKYHGAVVSHAGHEHTRVFGEVAALGEELHTLSTGDGATIVGARSPARVALIFSWPNWWNVEYVPGPSDQVNYVGEILRYYRPLWERNVAVDVISAGRLAESDGLNGYDLVLAPLLNMISETQAKGVERYVEQGGTFLTTYFSGVVDENDRAWLGGYPGPLRRTLGIWVEEYDPLELDMTNSLIVPVASGSADPARFSLPQGRYTCDLWCDLLHLESATALATYGEDFYAGRPAITVNSLGAGHAFYVATRPDPTLLQALIRTLTDDLRIAGPLPHTPAGVEVTQRLHVSGIPYIFVLNHRSDSIQVPLRQGMRELLTGATHSTEFTLPGRGVAILTPAT